jgi:hypothetical protein
MNMRHNNKKYLKAFLVVFVGVLYYAIIVKHARDRNMLHLVTEPNIVSEAREVRKTNRAAVVDISEIVKKYVKLGASREAVRVYLMNSGFSLSFQPIREVGKEVLIAVESPLNKTLFGFLGFEDEIKLIVEFNQGAVGAASGQIIFRAL